MEGGGGGGGRWEGRRPLAEVRRGFSGRKRAGFRARSHRRLSAADPSVAQRSAQPDGLLVFLFVRDIADGDRSAGSTGNSSMPMTQPTPTGCPDCGKLWLDRSGRSTGSRKGPDHDLVVHPVGRPQRLRLGTTSAPDIAIDTLVHNFLVRTGVLARFAADHSYGAACYQAGGCADIIAAVAARIDAREFNPGFPQLFPRFVQHAIWRFCAQSGLDVCNGNRIDDRKSCDNVYCQIRSNCDRIILNSSK